MTTHRTLIERIERKHRLAVDRAIDEFARRQAWVADGGDPNQFVPATELPRRLTDTMYDAPK